LFQENKSFGSKKPFEFILWCARSCVEHKLFSLYTTQYKQPLDNEHGWRHTEGERKKSNGRDNQVVLKAAHTPSRRD
jgi:hypothetical protein